MFLNEQKGEITSQKGTDIMEELEELILSSNKKYVFFVDDLDRAETVKSFV